MCVKYLLYILIFFETLRSLQDKSNPPDYRLEFIKLKETSLDNLNEL